MKNLISSIVVLFLLQTASAQVHGRLAKQDNTPVASASIQLLNSSDSLLLRTVSTNDSGFFKIENLSIGKYLLKFTAIGFQSLYSSIIELASDSSKELGTFILQQESKQLAEVVVRAQKPLYQQRIDGMVVNVQNDILAKGSSAMDVLLRSPGVSMDYRNNSFSLNGKGGVNVMLDGKMLQLSGEQLVSLLNSLSADDIDKIELLTTPPAKYDAEGSAGFINIVLKKNKKMGTNGSLSLTGGYGWREKGTASINLAHNTKKVNLYGSYTFMHNRTYSDLFITGSQNMPFLGGDVAVIYYDTTHATENNHDAAISADFKLNNKTTIGSSVTFNHSLRSATTITNAGYNVLPDSLLQFNGDNRGTAAVNHLISSVYLEKQIKEKEKINFDLDYIYFNSNAPSEVSSSFVNSQGTQANSSNNLFSPGQKGFAQTAINVLVAKMDYTKQLSKKINLEAGVKGNYTKNNSTSGIQSLVNGEWTSSDETTNNIFMKEWIGAAYASFNVQLDPSTNLILGARYEYSYTDMVNAKTDSNLVNRKLGAIFPTVFFSKKINDRSEFQFSYTKRIGRPSYNDLASYVAYSDPTAVYTGNPFLKPSITNNLKIGYNYSGYSFSLLFSRDENPIYRYQLTESPAKDILYISPQNLAWQNSLTLQINLPIKINNWWTMTYSFAGGPKQYKADYTIVPFEKTYFSYIANFNQSFLLPKNYSVELSGWYNSRWYNSTVEVDHIGALNFGIKKELKKNGGSLQFSVTDVLRNIQYNVHYGVVTEEPFSIKSNVQVNTETRVMPILKLTYTKSFGTGTKTARKQTDNADEEKERIKRN